MSLKAAVARTIRYFNKYNCKPNGEEFKKRLITKKWYTDREIEAAVKNYQTLSRNKANRWAKIKKQKANRLVKEYLSRIPTILMVGISGSVATNYPKRDDDIDLLIVTQNQSLWISRLGVVLWLKINGIKLRSQGKNGQNDDFCFNLWMEKDSLLMPDNKRNLRNAMDLIMLQPIFNRDGVYQELLKQNTWAEKYVVNGLKRSLAGEEKRVSQSSASWWVKGLNWLAFWPQFWYMRPKMTGELVNLKQAFFHPGSQERV